MGMILSHSNVQVSVTAYSDIHFSVQLQEVFTYMFTCASHQPAAFCKYLIYATYSFHCLSINVIITFYFLFVNTQVERNCVECLHIATNIEIISKT